MSGDVFCGVHLWPSTLPLVSRLSCPRKDLHMCSSPVHIPYWVYSLTSDCWRASTFLLVFPSSNMFESGFNHVNAVFTNQRDRLNLKTHQFPTKYQYPCWCSSDASFPLMISTVSVKRGYVKSYVFHKLNVIYFLRSLLSSLNIICNTYY